VRLTVFCIEISLHRSPAAKGRQKLRAEFYAASAFGSRLRDAASYRVTRRPVKKYSIAPIIAASPVTHTTGGSLMSFFAGAAAALG
jgi:hypothetical protein